jgi:hypothetical protein
LDPPAFMANRLNLDKLAPMKVSSKLFIYITKTINLAKALKDQFPNLVIFGPVHYGFEGIYNWQGELSATPGGNN